MAKAKASVEDLIRQALLKAAEAPGEVKLTGKEDGLFATASGANKEAITASLHAEKPLLTIVRKEGKTEFVALTPAGFDRIASDLPEEKAGPLAKSVATALPSSERIAFIQATIGRTPLATAELIPLLEEAIAAEKAEHEARVAATAKRKAAEEAAQKALTRALELFEERRKNRLDALQREWEAEGGSAAELPPHETRPQVALKVVSTDDEESDAPRPEATTDDARDFRRDSADQFAAAWRAAWDGKKAEALEYLESAMWNINGLKLRGEAGARVAFDGRYHQSETPAFTGDTVKIARPGWVLDEGDGRDYVALKAVVEKA